jgi:Flp pilus assembly protein TadD
LLLGMNKFGEAEACLRSALQLDPKDALVKARIGDSLAKRGRTEEARASYNDALSLDANCAAARAGLDRLTPKA